MNWVPFSHESKYLSIRGYSWDSGPEWNRGIRFYLSDDIKSALKSHLGHENAMISHNYKPDIIMAIISLTLPKYVSH